MAEQQRSPSQAVARAAEPVALAHEAATAGTAGLHLRAVDVGYAGRSVLRGLTLRTPLTPGTVLGVLGPNGVGKSTLLRSLARLQAAQGQALLYGAPGGPALDLLHGPRARHQAEVAYLPQSLPQPSSLRVLEALEVALQAACPELTRPQREQRVHAVLLRLQLRPLALRPLRELSGGQRQMLGLGQVLLRQAALLLLDEPTSALDLRWQLLALQAVREEAQQRGAIACVALHDLALAGRHCQRLLLLGPGGVVAEGPPAEVLRPEHLQRAYGVQARVEFSSRGEPCVLVDAAGAPA